MARHSNEREKTQIHSRLLKKKQTHDRKREGGERWGNVHDPKLVEPETADTDPLVFFFNSFCLLEKSELAIGISDPQGIVKILRLISEKMSALYFHFASSPPRYKNSWANSIGNAAIRSRFSLFRVISATHNRSIRSSIDQTMDDQRNFLSTFGEIRQNVSDLFNVKTLVFFPPGDFPSLIFLQNNVPMMCAPLEEKK